MHTRKGFTLLELVIAIALAAVLTALATPAFESFSRNLKIRAVTERLASDLNHARHAAVNRGHRVSACPGNETTGCSGSPDWHQGWIVFEDVNGDRHRGTTEPVLRVSPPLRGITARSSAGRHLVGFFANGSAPGSNATIWLCDGRGPEYGWQIRVSLAGRIRTTSARRDGALGC